MVYLIKIVRLGLALAILMLPGCVGGETEKFTIGPDGVRAKVIAEMDAVSSNLSKSHFDECRRQVEKKNIIGDQFKVKGQFNRSLRHSCAAIYPPNPLSGLSAGTGYKRVAYVATKVRIAGFGSHSGTAVCVFKMKDGRIELDKYSRYTKLRSDHICHQI